MDSQANEEGFVRQKVGMLKPASTAGISLLVNVTISPFLSSARLHIAY